MVPTCQIRKYTRFCRKVALFDTIAAVLAALVIIPAMATTGAQLNQGGPGLLFIFLPNLIRSMPGGRIIAIIFFVSRIPCRDDITDQLIRSTNCNGTGKISSRKSSSLRCDRGYRCGRISSDPGHCIPVDGCSVDLHLPARRRPCRSHVLLDLRKEYVQSQVDKGRSSKFTDLYYPICKYIYVPICVLVLILGIVLGGIG